MTGGWLLGAVWLGAAALHLLYGVAFLVRCIHVGRSRPSVFMCAVVICVWPLLVNRILFMAFDDDEGDHYEDENRADDHVGGDSRTVVGQQLERSVDATIARQGNGPN